MPAYKIHHEALATSLLQVPIIKFAHTAEDACDLAGAYSKKSQTIRLKRGGTIRVLRVEDCGTLFDRPIKV